MKTLNAILFILALFNLGLWIYFIHRRSVLDHSHSRWQIKEKERKQMKEIDNKVAIFSILTLSIISIIVILNMELKW